MTPSHRVTGTPEFMVPHQVHEVGQMPELSKIDNFAA